MWNSVQFFKSKIGILAMVLCLVMVAAILWYCLMGTDRNVAPEGTLVWQHEYEH